MGDVGSRVYKTLFLKKKVKNGRLHSSHASHQTVPGHRSLQELLRIKLVYFQTVPSDPQVMVIEVLSTSPGVFSPSLLVHSDGFTLK